MSVEVKNRRGTTAEHSTFTGAVAEITVDTDKNTAVVHDGVTAGGHPVSLSADLGTAAAADTSTLLARSNHTGTQPLSTISDSGTAAAKDTGTAAGEVPLNSDLGTAATADTDDLSVKQASNITVTVGASGDFATINAALTHLSGLYPEYKNTGVTATVELQSGFVMEEQVLVRGMDLGWVTITGVDAETVIDHTELTIDFTTADYGFDSYPAFGVRKGGTLPRIAQLFSMSSGSATSEDKHGVLAVGAGSSAEIDSGCGVKNAGSNGIYAVYASAINANGANASGAGNIGIYANQGSTISANSADASNAGDRGIYANDGSTISANSADASGAGTYGFLAARGSIISANDADASNAGDRGIYAIRGSTINARGALIKDQTAGTYAIRVADGSHIEASAIDTSGTSVTVLSQSANTLTGSGIIYQ